MLPPVIIIIGGPRPAVANPGELWFETFAEAKAHLDSQIADDEAE